MIIDGQKIKMFQRKIPKTYHTIMLRESRQSLRALPFVQLVTYKIAPTNSIYLFVTINHMSSPIVVSIRSHYPKHHEPGYIYVYAPKFETLTKMSTYIKNELIKKYNHNLIQQHLPINPYTPKTSTKRKCYKRNQRKEKRDTYQELVEHINGGFL